MTEETTPEISVEDLQAQLAEQTAKIEDIEKQRVALLSKNEELLNETKKAKTKAREEAEAKSAAEKEKAEKAGEFEQLYKSSEKERQSLREELQNLYSNIGKEKTWNEAMKIASEFADGYKAELLAEKIQPRMRWTEDGLKVVDASGALTVSTQEDLKNEFANNEKYHFLFRGNKSSGGGASGGGKVSDSGTISRSDFNELSQIEKAKFFKSGGKIQQ